MSNNNRKRGNAFELYVIKKLREYLPNDTHITSRMESKRLDAEKVDIVTTADVSIQCKNIMCTTKVRKINIEPLIELQTFKHPKSINALITRMTRKKGNRFITDGQYAVLPLEEFFELLRRASDKS